jgi:integrase
LVVTLFGFLIREGKIPTDWFARQVAQADRTDGDLDTLSTRIAHIRTWTFAANRPDWLADPDHCADHRMNLIEARNRLGLFDRVDYPAMAARAGRGSNHGLTTRQYARLVGQWVASIGLDPLKFGTHSLRRTKATLIYRRTGNLRAVQLLLGHTKIESTVRYLGIEIDDAIEIAEKIEV